MKLSSDGKYMNDFTSTKTIPSASTLWMFTGQGSIVAGAARPLYQADPLFKQALNKYTSLLKESLDLPLLDLLIDEKSKNAHLI